MRSTSTRFNGGLPKEGPPLHGYDPDHPFGIAPRTADDNLAYWLYGCRTSLSIAGMSTLAATLIGIVAGPDRRLRRRHRSTRSSRSSPTCS